MAEPDHPPDPRAAVVITDELQRRPAASPDHLREKQAIQDLAQQMADRPTEIIPRLVALAMEICDGASAGVSVLDAETNRFRWLGVQGALAAMQGVTVPRENSPAGVCLDVGGPVLMAQPGRAFGWIRGALPVSELLLVPLQSKGAPPLGTLWVIAKDAGHFNSGHARALGDLAAFAAIALRMIQSEERLSQALRIQETLADEMSHRVKNVFALAEGMVRLSARSALSIDDLAAKLMGRLHALADAHALVRRRFNQMPWEGADFAEILTRILLPHDDGRSLIRGPALSVGQRAVNNLALLFHELATNAAKYGSLSVEQGAVEIEWDADETEMSLQWREAGGPVTRPPERQGNGVKLVNATMQQLGGTIDYDWRPEGLIARLRLPIASFGN
ncbi:sensor histidine kinase [Bradyrhizobium sp.]|uniref:sensor histidine kinase n=1 Tax=Bradyrhizobium sp. TaxID=376 RepID=UPI003C3662F3